MLRRLSGIALTLGLAMASSNAFAVDQPATPTAVPAAEAGAGDRAAPPKTAAVADAAASASVATYSHIYQSPLFGSLFATTSSEAAVDESALRYYASLHNVARANAEIRRLKALHPNWTPPTNIYSTAGAGNDEQPFWDLLAADRLDELRAGIALRMKNEPGWKPSRDLKVKIERKEAMEKLVKVSDQEKWTDVLEIADADPSILHCAYMDANWRVAEAFLKTGQSPRAFEIYHAIIATCSDHNERLITVRKAISRFSVDQVKSLIAMGAKSGDGATEFDETKIDLTRARMAAVNAGKTKDDIEPEALAVFFTEVERSMDRADLALAGWYQYDRGRGEEAAKWFKLGLPASPLGKDPDDVKFAEGYALSLLKSDQIDKALRVAWEWRDASVTMRRAYVSAMTSLLTSERPSQAISDAMIAEFVEFIEADRSFEGGQALAWFRENRKEWDEAASWFETSLAWKGIDPLAEPPAGLSDRATFKAIEGYGAALANVGRIDEALQIADTWRSADASLRTLFLALAMNAVNSVDRTAAIAPERLDHFSEIVVADRLAAGAQALGWLEYRSGDFALAVDWFGKAIAWSPGGKGELKLNQGYALALRAAGRPQEAEDFAWTWRQQSPDLRAIYISSVVAQLSRDDLRSRFGTARLERFKALVRADRSAIGAQALGWHRLQAGNCGYAAPWFRAALAWSADRETEAKKVEGLALALSAVGEYAAAEDVAYAWRDRSGALRALYVKIGVEELTREAPVVPMSEARINRFAAVVLADRVSLGAQALAWRRYRQAGCGYGGDWFRLAALWLEDDKRDAKTDEGYGLALRAIGRLAEAEALAKHWADKVPAMQKLYIDVMVEQLARDNPPEPIDEARLADFVATIEPMRSPLGAQALGWYRLERGELGEAAKWFKNAVDWWPPQRKDLAQHLSAPTDDYKPILAKLTLVHEQYRRTPRAYPNSSALIGKTTELYVNTPEGAAKTMEGYVLTLRALGRLEEAERIAYSWRDRWPSLRALFIDIAIAELARTDGPPLSSERLDRYLGAITEDRSIPGAAAVAWRQYGRKDFAGAADWFKTALDWSQRASNAPADPGLAEGYILALRGANQFDEALRVAARWRAASARLNVLYLETTLLDLQNSGQADKLSAQKYAEIEAAMTGARSPDGALAIGWIAFQNQDYARALTWFQNALDWSPEKAGNPKAAEGLALSLRGLGRYDELAAFARDWRETSPQVRGIYYGGMTEWFDRAEPLATVKPEISAEFEMVVDDDRSPSGAQAVAWGYALRQNPLQAGVWFRRALDWSAIDPRAPRPDARPDKSTVKLIEGYVAALRGAGELAGAEEIAFAWRERGEALHGLYMQIFTQELATAETAARIPADRLSRFTKTTLAERSPIGAQNLGWLSYRAKDWDAAIIWFADAIAWSPPGVGDAKTNEGYALALRAAGRLREAEDFAWTWRQQSADLRATYISAVVAQLARDDLRSQVSAARVERFSTIVRADRSAIGAQALGWHRLQAGNCGYAAPWFRAALAWSADRETEAKMVEGLALALSAVGHFAQAEDVAYAWRDRSASLRALYVKIGVEELTREAPVVPMSEARINRFATIVLADRVSLGAQALAWRRYRQAGCGYGGDWFRLAALWLEDDKRDAKTDEGYGLALRAIGRLAEAEALAKHWADKVPAMQKFYIDVMVEELARDNPPEPIDEARLADFVATIEPIRSPLGAQALGWYRLERGELGEAAKWFKNAVDWWPPQRKDLAQHLSAPTEDYKPILAKLTLVHEQYRRTPRAYPNSSALIGKTTELYVNTPEGAAKTMEGYVLTLRASGRLEEAERIAYSWRDRWPSLRALFIDIAIAELARTDGPPLSSERLDRYLGAITEDRSIPGAAAVAWRQYGRKDFAGAADWFKTALDWSQRASEAAPDPALVEGDVLALRSAKRFDEALAIAEQWRKSSPRLNLLFLETTLISPRESARTDKLSAAKYREIEAALIQARSPEGAVSIGWIVYESGDYATALMWFRNAVEWRPVGQADPKALEGVALALRGLGRFDELVAFARQWRETSPTVRSAYYGAMMESLDRADPLADVKPEIWDDFESLVQDDRNPDGATAIGWAFSLRKDWRPAETWFKAALDWSAVDPLTPAANASLGKPRAKLIEGYVQALRNGGRLAPAEDIAFAWREQSELRGLYMQVFTQELAAPDAAEHISADRVARFAKVTNEDRSPIGAQNMGWLSYRARDSNAALAWFERAMQWSPEGKGDAKTNEGYALSLRAAGRLEAAEEFAWAWREQAPELRAVYIAAVSDQLFRPELAARLTPARLERFSGVVRTDKSAAGAQAMGWRRLQDGNCGYSVGWFRASLAWSKDHKDEDKANSGLAQGLRAIGMFSEAENVAWAWRDRSKELRKLYIDIGVEELTRPWPRVEMSEDRLNRFGSIAFADRSSVAAQALAWRRYGEAGCGYGVQWFRLAATWSDDGRGDAKLNEGYALGLRAAGRLKQAEALAYPWSEIQLSMKKLYIDIAVEELSRDNPPEPMPAPRIALFEATITPLRSSLGAQALGWYRYARGENAEAAKWFQNALDWWPHPKNDGDQKLTQPVDDYKAILASLALRPEDYRRTPRAYPNSSLLIGKATESYVDTTIGLARTVEGYVLSLRAIGRLDEAERLAFDWRDRWPRLRELFIELAISELTAEDGPKIASDRIDRFVQVVEADRSARGAEALGWRAFAAQDNEAASRWFKSSLDWSQGGKDAAPSFNVIQAYALSLRGAKQYGEALRVLNAWRAKMPALEALYADVGFEELQTIDPATPAAAQKLNEIATGVTRAKSAAGANSLGWLAYQRKEYAAAQAWFKQAIVWTLPGGLPDAKALEGYARCLQARERFSDLLKFAGEWSERVPSLKPLYLEAAAQTLGAAAASGEEVAMDVLARAGAAFAQQRSANGAQALAWQRIAAKDWVAAAAWFQAARTWSNADAIDPKINEGLIIALRNLHRDDEAEELAFAGAARDENLRELYIETVVDRLTRSPPAPPNERGMRRFAEFVAAAKSANAAQALGWYSYNARQLPAAIAWFEKSIDWDPSENAALGLAFAFRQSGDRAAYARVLAAYGAQYSKLADLAAGSTSRLQEGRAVVETAEAAPARAAPTRARAEAVVGARSDGGSIASALTAKDYATCVVRADEAARDGELSAEQHVLLGWCLLNLGRSQEAARAFDEALPNSTGKTREDAAYGKSLALLAAGEAKQAGAAASQADLAADRRNAIGLQILEQRAWDAYGGHRYAETIHWLDRRAAFAAETRELMELRAHCLDKLGQSEAAQTLLDSLDAQLAK